MALDILHVHSTFALGGKEARAVRLMNAFGDHAHHTILSAVPDALDARDAIAPGIAANFPHDHPPIVGKPAPGRYRDLARYMRRFDLVLTYNWGAMDAVGARRLFGGTPLIHHEDGFNQDEAARQKPARVWFRRVTLPAAHAVVVPSERLERIARESWWQVPLRIANGIEVERYARPVPGTIPGLRRGNGEVVVGTLAGLRAVKNLPRLVRAVAPLPHVRLVIVGEGPERGAILAEAARLGVADRVHLAGFLPEPEHYVGLFDIFALSSDSEQFPISLIEAMAAGLPIVSTDVGDVCTMVSLANRRLVVPVEDEAAYAVAMARLAGDRALRVAIGAANREKALADYGEDAMIDAYRRLYGAAAGAAGFFREMA
ncbi:glycosyltransferase family 4 protein [Sphingomonas sp. 1P06PA]|uniref:glycosyltransferase family 4 protein n=1 Tax=Sphingomonas sp. 1P06PA TaxID=554121 RepID=UPI0039A407C7